MRGWTERFPERFEHELAAFAERGLEFEVDRELLERQSRVVLRGSIVHADEEIPLEIAYPDLFPYLRPEVYAKGLRRERHQNPYDGNLCLLDRSTRAWSPHMTGAWLIAERVPLLLDLLDEGGEALERAEAPQGEPVSTYFRSLAGTAIVVPEMALRLPLEARAGKGRIAFGAAEPPQLRVRGALVELVEKGEHKRPRTLARADEALLRRFGGAQLPLRWARLDRAPEENTAAGVLAAIEAAQPGFGLPPWKPVGGGKIAIAAAVFAEEVRQGVYEDTWVFAVQFRQERGAHDAYLIHGERFSRNDLEVRLPDYVRLGERTVALAGLGALGGELAVELAKAGLGTLHGLDPDAVEAGTTVRWAGGLTAVGHLKTEYVRQRLAFDYPYASFEPFPMRLGDSAVAAPAREETELDALDRFLDGADLLIDATAEIGVQQALAAEAATRDLRQLFVSATEGARGGLVALIDPSAGGCWYCLQMRLDEGSIPTPEQDEPLTLQPRGCGTLTYSGADFDLLPIVAQAVRVAAATLAADAESGGSLAFVCDFERERLSPPAWSEHPVKPHPDCPACGGSVVE